MAFINRIEELAALDERLRSARAEYFVLFGRRRVGKSSLLLHFGERCRQFYFEASSGSKEDQLEAISAELARFTGSRVYEEQMLTRSRRSARCSTALSTSTPSRPRRGDPARRPLPGRLAARGAPLPPRLEEEGRPGGCLASRHIPVGFGHEPEPER